MNTFLSVMTALGALLTAVFTGGLMWLQMQERRVSIIEDGEDAFIVSNHSRHSVVVRDFVAKGGSLWATGGKPSEVALLKKKDTGAQRVACGMRIKPGEEKRLTEALMIDGKKVAFTVIPRRVRPFRPGLIDLVLRPKH